MKQIVSKFDKQLLATLPRVLFAGKIEVVVSERDAEKAVRFLMKQPLLGFDTETRPCFKAGHQNQVALLQVSCESVCFLFRLNRMGLPKCLVRLLEDTKLPKAALSWHDDLRGLSHRGQFKPGTFIELQDLAKSMGIEDMSLQKLYANVLGGKISKGQQLSNWEADSLTEAQQLYAATDAWACIQLLREMTRMKAEGYELIPTSTDKPEEQL